MTRSLKVDFLGGEAEQKARRTTAIIAVVFAVAVGILSAVGAGASYRAAIYGTTVLEEVGNLPIIADIRRLAVGESASDMPQTPDNRLTFLLMGVGGAGHSGPQLSDTILLASIDLKDMNVGIVSIPRDLAFPLGGGRFVKINHVNAYAEESHPGQGARETADAFEDLFGIRIDHVVRVDFQGFEEFIDALGGIDVTVERSFTDTQYPTYDDKWTVISFQEGEQRMNGKTALQFVRSRHGSNGEAGDFARNRRQQIVMLAIKDRLLSLGTITNPSKLVKLYESVANNVQTDMTAWSMLKLAPLAKGVQTDKVVTTVLEDGANGVLEPANVNGAFMLFPKKQDWSEIREIVQNPYKTREERLAELKPQTEVRIEIRNGTNITGFASRMSDYLTQNGYLVQDVGNAGNRGYERTVIYDLTRGAKIQELARLRKLLDANVSGNIPGWLDASSPVGSTDTSPVERAAAKQNTDFLIVLGESSFGIVNPYGQ